MWLETDQGDVVSAWPVGPEDSPNRRRVVLEIRFENLPAVSCRERIDLVTLKSGMKWILLEMRDGLREPIPLGIHLRDSGDHGELRHRG